MIKILNSSYNDYAFNLKKSFIGVNLITAYHTVIEKPYYNPLLHDPQWNQLYFVFFVLKSSIKFLYEGKEIVVKEGQIMFGQTHNDPPIYLVDNGGSAEFVCFHFQLFNYPLSLYKPFTVPQGTKGLNTAKKILRYFRMKSDLGIGSANAAFMELLFYWHRRIHDSTTEKIPHHNDILEAELYINQHIEEKLSVADIAKKYNFSEKHFRYLFARIVGCTPKKYIERVKLERVYTLLKSTNLTVTQIADRLGFNNSHHLANAFKNAYNISPSECRKTTV